VAEDRHIEAGHVPGHLKQAEVRAALQEEIEHHLRIRLFVDPVKEALRVTDLGRNPVLEEDQGHALDHEKYENHGADALNLEFMVGGYLKIVKIEHIESYIDINMINMFPIH
jgi:hypothetical protein